MLAWWCMSLRRITLSLVFSTARLWIVRTFILLIRRRLVIVVARSTLRRIRKGLLVRVICCNMRAVVAYIRKGVVIRQLWRTGLRVLITDRWSKIDGFGRAWYVPCVKAFCSTLAVDSV